MRSWSVSLGSSAVTQRLAEDSFEESDMRAKRGPALRRQCGPSALAAADCLLGDGDIARHLQGFQMRAKIAIGRSADGFQRRKVERCAFCLQRGNHAQAMLLVDDLITVR